MLCWKERAGGRSSKKEPTRPSPPLCHYLCMHDFIYSVSVCFALNLFPAPLDGKLVFPQLCLPSAFVFNSKNETCLMSGRSSHSLFVLLAERAQQPCLCIRPSEMIRLIELGCARSLTFYICALAQNALPSLTLRDCVSR
jgi:hypothetical protein